MRKEKQYSYKTFMKKLGLSGELEDIRNIIVSLNRSQPYIEVIYSVNDESGKQ